MNLAEIVIRTEDQDDAILIANAITNGLENVGFENVNTSIIGATSHSDPELKQAMATINPELAQLPVDISYEPSVASAENTSDVPVILEAAEQADESIEFEEDDD